MSTGLDSMHPARALACRRFLWLVALLAIALSADPALADEDGRWQDFRFPIAPAPRFEHVFVFDEDQDRIILFGNSPEQDTWALSVGETPEWLQLTPTRYPPPRIYPAAVYDPIRKRVVMFGGRGTSLLNDVWVLEGTPGDWREIHPEGLGPSGRVGSTAVYQRARERIIVY